MSAGNQSMGLASVADRAVRAPIEPPGGAVGELGGGRELFSFAAHLHWPACRLQSAATYSELGGVALAQLKIAWQACARAP